jgi:isoquinoline 1-oxidoreductase beta subunit
VRGFWTSVREAGAAAREMLLAAAAQTWAVDVGECRTDAGKVVHAASGRSLEYGALVATAAVQPLPELLFLKDPTEFTLVGQSLPRLDTPAKTDGSAVFGQDVRLPGMLTATVLRCPVFGGKLRRFDAQAAKRIAGVREVLQISSGIAVVADGFWPANLGRDALSVEWDEGPGAELDDDIIRNQFRGAVTGGRVVRNDGDAEAMLAAAADALKAVYEVPFLAHACMEPMNATADVRKDGCDIWAPTQGQTATQQTAMKLTGLPAEKVRVHTTFLSMISTVPLPTTNLPRCSVRTGYPRPGSIALPGPPS